MIKKFIKINNGKSKIQFVVKNDAISELKLFLENYANYAVVIDKNVLELDSNKFKFFKNLICIEANEENKSVEKFVELIGKFSELGLKRNDCIVCVGGGIIGDLGGFAASTYLRGIDFVHVPTTLLAMVDSSIGGKTGVNTSYGKNLLGTTAQPKAIFCDLDFLKSHSDKLIKDGLGEVVKQAFIGDLGLIRAISKSGLTEKNIIRASSVKLKLVKKDPFEKSVRKYLNVGHTFAHAIEKESNFSIPHGEAVAIGMKCETKLGFEAGIVSEKNMEFIVNTIDEILTPREYEIQNLDKFMSFMGNDKKNTDSRISCAIIVKPGKKITIEKFDFEFVLKFLKNAN